MEVTQDDQPVVVAFVMISGLLFGALLALNGNWGADHATTTAPGASSGQQGPAQIASSAKSAAPGEVAPTLSESTGL